MKHLSKNKEGIIQFIQFCLVGASNVAVLIITSWSFFYFFKADAYIGNTAGFITSVTNAFLWNTFWVFKKQKVNKKRAMVKFFSVYIFTYFLSMFITFIFVDVVGGDKYFSPFINTAITTPINFLLSKFWTFSEKQNTK